MACKDFCDKCENNNTYMCEKCNTFASYGKIIGEPTNFKQKSIDDKDVYYIVKVKDVTDDMFYKTTISNKFCGKLVNQNDGKFYFELNGSNALVIIPHSWIEWMAPSKKIWDLRRDEKDEKNNM